MNQRYVATHRGSALVAVLVIVVIGVLLAAGIMARAVSRVEDSSLSLRRSGARAMAWSGVRAAMSGLAAQREMLMTGGDALWTDSKAWEFADPDGPGIWKVSLVGLNETGDVGIAEAALVNVNTASEDQLSKISILGPTGAAGVLGRRARGPIVAPEQIQAMRSTTPVQGVVAGADATLTEGGIGSTNTDAPDAWLTALSADATVMITDGKSERYRPSDLTAKDLADAEKAAQDERLASGAGAARVWAQRPEHERTLANLVVDLQAANIPATEWGKVLDSVEVTEDLFVLGRIDISRASEGVLATLPGMTVELASNLVRVRATLDESGRRDLAWPVVSGALDAKVFAAFADFITTRSLQYRVRVEAGRTTRSDATGVEADEFGAARDVEAPLTDRCVFEAVIDVAGDEPRIAYLRDITLLKSAAQVAAAAAMNEESALTPIDDADSAESGMDQAPVEPSDEGAEGATSMDAGLDPESGLQSNRLQGSGGLDLGGGIDRTSSPVEQSESDSKTLSRDDQPASTGASSTANAGATITKTAGRADPRLGRWNSTALRASQRPAAGTQSGADAKDGVQLPANDVGTASSRTEAAGKGSTKRTPAKSSATRKEGGQ